MKEIKINSRNATFQKIVVLKTNRNKRYKYKEFFVEGVRNINEAIKNHWQISSFIYSDKSKLSDWAKNKIASIKIDLSKTPLYMISQFFNLYSLKNNITLQIQSF